jgi:hypothetical protein
MKGISNQHLLHRNGMAQCSRNVSPKTSKTLEDTIITVDLEELETSYEYQEILQMLIFS